MDFGVEIGKITFESVIDLGEKSCCAFQSISEKNIEDEKTEIELTVSLREEYFKINEVKNGYLIKISDLLQIFSCKAIL